LQKAPNQRFDVFYLATVAACTQFKIFAGTFYYYKWHFGELCTTDFVSGALMIYEFIQ